MKTGNFWDDREGLCPECGAVECIGLTNGNGFCSMCQTEFKMAPAETDEQISMCAKMATYWRALARNWESTHGVGSDRFSHGCANLWENMLPPERPNVEQIEIEGALEGK